MNNFIGILEIVLFLEENIGKNFLDISHSSDFSYMIPEVLATKAKRANEITSNQKSFVQQRKSSTK